MHIRTRWNDQRRLRIPYKESDRAKRSVSSGSSPGKRAVCCTVNPRRSVGTLLAFHSQRDPEKSETNYFLRRIFNVGGEDG